MSSKKATANYRVSDFYDGGLIRLDNVEVPSKRVGYKEENGVFIAKVPLGVPAFEKSIAEIFGNPNNKNWPLSGRLLVGIGITMPKSAYLTKDVDNMAKSILDAFRGIAYQDDKQIDSLFVSKSLGKAWQVWIALKSLSDNQKSWFIEPMLIKIHEDTATPESL
ncbi:MAG: RusA family crossover junction endodeoxyribonuclease [Methylophilaceae bacterium]